MASQNKRLSFGAQLLRLILIASKLRSKVILNYLRLTKLRPRRVGVMSYQACKEYLCAIVDGYKKASKSEKTRILDEASRITEIRKKKAPLLLRSLSKF